MNITQKVGPVYSALFKYEIGDRVALNLWPVTDDVKPLMVVVARGAEESETGFYVYYWCSHWNGEQFTRHRVYEPEIRRADGGSGE